VLGRPPSVHGGGTWVGGGWSLHVVLPDSGGLLFLELLFIGAHHSLRISFPGLAKVMSRSPWQTAPWALFLPGGSVH
jgi:hypothetical protein